MYKPKFRARALKHREGSYDNNDTERLFHEMEGSGYRPIDSVCMTEMDANGGIINLVEYHFERMEEEKEDPE